MANKENAKQRLEELPKDWADIYKKLEDDANLQAWFALFYNLLRPDLSRAECLSEIEDFLTEARKPPKANTEETIFTDLQLKKVLAHIIKYTIPVFEDESIEEIVRLLENEEKPESLYVENLSEHSHRLLRPQFEHDLVFKIKLPEGSESKYAYFIIGLEPQSYRTNYPLEVRAVLYAADLFIGENQWLLFTKTEQSYKESVPAYCIFLNLATTKKTANTVDHIGLLARRKKLENGEMVEVPIESESLINAIIVNVGKDYEDLPEGLFNFVGNLMFNQSDEKTKAFFDKYDLVETMEEKEMLMTGYERAKYEKAKKEGKAEGRTETLEKARTNLIDSYRRNGFSDEKINEELIRYGYKPLD